MWPKPGTSGDTRQGWFPYTSTRRFPLSLFESLLTSSFCFALSCRPRQWDLTSHAWSALKPEPGREADQQPATLYQRFFQKLLCQHATQRGCNTALDLLCFVQGAGDHLPVGGATIIFLLCRRFYTPGTGGEGVKYWNWSLYEVVLMQKINSHTVTNLFLRVKELSCCGVHKTRSLKRMLQYDGLLLVPLCKISITSITQCCNDAWVPFDRLGQTSSNTRQHFFRRT